MPPMTTAPAMYSDGSPVPPLVMTVDTIVVKGHTHGPGHSEYPFVDGNGRGLSDTVGEYRLVADSVPADSPQDFQFHIEKGGLRWKNFGPMHGALLHLVAIDAAGKHYVHEHPSLSPDGGWHVNLDLGQGQFPWRLVAHTMVPEGELVLGTTIGGDPRPLTVTDQRTVTTPGEDVVTLSFVERAKGGVRLVFSITDEQGNRISHVDEYLQSAGHLVLFRAKDRAYWHLHPQMMPMTPLEFLSTDLPAGSYIGFLQYKTHGVVHTRRFEIVLDV